MKKLFKDISVIAIALSIVTISLLSISSPTSPSELQDVPAAPISGETLSSSTTVPSDFTVNY